MKAHHWKPPIHPLALLLALCLGASSPAAQIAKTVQTRTAGKTAPAVQAGEAAQAAQPNPPGAEKGLRLNFRGVPLEMVLDYLSEAAGFVILMDTEVTGTVNVWNNQPLSKDEAVDLLDTILHEKGYTAIRRGRVLKIVKRGDAPTEDLPVQSGNDPEQIPKSDSMVTQIIPVRYTDAGQLIEDLQSLIPDYAKISANEGSNAIVLTDTQTNVRRMTKIIQALDTSISAISTIRVFPLQYSDATELAGIITELFESPRSQAGGRGGSADIRRAIFERFRSLRGGGGAPSGGRGRGDRGSRRGSSGPSKARQAATRVVAVADERTNSLVVGAPEELMPTIEDLIRKIDTDVDEVTELRVFHLQYADATEMSEMLTQLFEDEDQDQNNRSRIRFSPGGFRGRSGRGRSNDTSQRMHAQKRVTAVADPRTNSVIVSAARNLMDQIAKMVEQLDSNSAKKQNVFVFSLEHADVDNVADILRNMFEQQSGTFGRNAQNRSSRNNNPLNNRTVRNQGGLQPTLGQGRPGSGRGF